MDLAELAYARINALPVKFIKHIDERLLKEACTFKANYMNSGFFEFIHR